jgi:CheY-like chemotaxis protein
MAQVIANLLTNAAKYTEPGGQIRLCATRAEGGLVISVKDTGVDLEPKSIPELFVMFSQVNASLNHAEGGLGIGLALVKGLVELHGGSIEARSEGLGKGSEFLVRLPASVVCEAPPEGARKKVSHSDVPKVRAKVLIADDNRDAGETLAAVLRMNGYDVSLAFDGAEAFERASRERPHAMVLDIGMPGMSGFDVAARVRREAWGREVPLIAITGWGQEHDKAKAAAAGFDEHLTKPADPMVVAALLDNMLKSPRGGGWTASAAEASESDPGRFLS